MTVYLWHFVPVIVIAVAFYGTGVMPQPAIRTAQWWELRRAWFALLTVVLVPLMAVVMRAERPMRRLPAGIGPPGVWSPLLLAAGLGTSMFGLARLAIARFAPGGQLPTLALAVCAAGLAATLLTGRAPAAGVKPGALRRSTAPAAESGLKAPLAARSGQNRQATASHHGPGHGAGYRCRWAGLSVMSSMPAAVCRSCPASSANVREAACSHLQGAAFGLTESFLHHAAGQKPLAANQVRALPGNKEVSTMPGLRRREPRGEAADIFGRFDRLFDEWARMTPFRSMPFPPWRGAEDLIRMEAYRQDGVLVIRADLPGIDPDKDVELTVSDGMLHIEAERREEEKQEGRGYVRQEVHYGSLSRSVPLPAGVTGADITATYKAGVLEIRVPEPKREEPRKIAISKA